MDKEIKFIIKVFCLWIIFLGLWGFIGFQLIPKESIHGKTNFLDSFSNWDGGHFLGIAQNGYLKDYQYAFFPLYPILIRFVAEFLGSFLLAALVINLIAFFISLLLFLKLIILDFKSDTAKKGLIALLIFPTSFYLLVTYSESIFLLFSVACFYFARKNNFLLATLFASFASGSRFVGLATIIGLWVEAIYSKKPLKDKSIVLFAPVGFIAYLIYLFIHTGNPIYFLIAEEDWQRYIVLPGLGVWKSLNTLFTTSSILLIWQYLLDIIFFVLTAGLVLRSSRFLRKSYVIYGIISLILPIFTTTLISMPRFSLVIFPLFILIAKLSNKIFLIYTFFSFLLLIYFWIRFINGYWVS